MATTARPRGNVPRSAPLQHRDGREEALAEGKVAVLFGNGRTGLSPCPGSGARVRRHSHRGPGPAVQKALKYTGGTGPASLSISQDDVGPTPGNEMFMAADEVAVESAAHDAEGAQRPEAARRRRSTAARVRPAASTCPRAATMRTRRRIPSNATPSPPRPAGRPRRRGGWNAKTWRTAPRRSPTGTRSRHLEASNGGCKRRRWRGATPPRCSNWRAARSGAQRRADSNRAPTTPSSLAASLADEAEREGRARPPTLKRARGYLRASAAP